MIHIKKSKKTERQMDRGLLLIGGITLAIILLGGSLLYVLDKNDSGRQLAASFSGTDADVVSAAGVHWHPELAIYIHGQKQEIPADIGIGPQYANNRWYDPMMQMTDIHTHDTSGILHWEVMQGPTKKGHARLGNFFEIWGKPFNRQTLFDNANGKDGTLTMKVNGKPSQAFEQYIVRDKDRIEIRFE